jgi:hypothetical protein
MACALQGPSPGDDWTLVSVWVQCVAAMNALTSLSVLRHARTESCLIVSTVVGAASCPPLVHAL